MFSKTPRFCNELMLFLLKQKTYPERKSSSSSKALLILKMVNIKSDLMLRMVFRRNLLYFASLVIFMDGLYLENDFPRLFLSFYYFQCYSYCFVGVGAVSGFLFCFYFYYHYYHYYYYYYYYFMFIKFSSLWLCQVLFY